MTEEKETKKKSGVGRFCSRCNRPIDEHPRLGIYDDARLDRYCEVVLVEDIKLPDGTTKTIEAINQNDTMRTKENNKRYVHVSNFKNDGIIVANEEDLESIQASS